MERLYYIFLTVPIELQHSLTRLDWAKIYIIGKLLMFTYIRWGFIFKFFMFFDENIFLAV